MHYAKWQRPDSKGYIVHDSSYLTFCKTPTHKDEY